MTHRFYVSITGLALKRPWHVFRFYRLAIPCFKQAQAAPGNIGADVRTIDGIHHTRTVWRDKECMKAFVYSGVHLQAIRSFRAMASGKTFGYETDRVPDWDEVHRLWLERGHAYEDAA